MKNHIQKTIIHRIKAGAVAAILAGAFFPMVSNAQQISRVDASRMSCHALQDTIWSRGAVIVRSRSPSSGMRLSERYVSDRGFCFHNEVARYRDVATGDTDSCSVKLCTEQNRRKNRF